VKKASPHVLNVGPRLRALRKSQELSLVDLSAQAELSIGMLSQIERGISTPSLNSLARIAGALGIPVMDLFDPRGPESISGAEAIIGRRDTRQTLSFEELGLVKEILSPRKSPHLEMIMVVLESGGSSGGEPYSHDGEEGGYVLSGSMELQVGGCAHLLGPGDTFQFSSAVPHCFRNAAPNETRVLWVLTTPLHHPLTHEPITAP
jgi:transcriptional regulator with XRE-family HTH domain